MASVPLRLAGRRLLGWRWWRGAAAGQPRERSRDAGGQCREIGIARTGFGVDRLKRLVKGRESVVVGQSGVGKSSLLNAVDESLRLRVEAVSTESEKGRHTTAAAQLLPLACGGYVVDTPGVRQFQLWDVIPEEVAGFFRDVRPYVSLCRFPDCTHTHEDDCAVKDAVADGRLDERRYESYCVLLSGDME